MNIFSKAESKKTNNLFMLSSVRLEIAYCYEYLVIKLGPSGRFSVAAGKVCTKARRTLFSISNIVYKNRQPVSKEFQLFDLLVSSVAL